MKVNFEFHNTVIQVSSCNDDDKCKCKVSDKKNKDIFYRINKCCDWILINEDTGNDLDRLNNSGKTATVGAIIEGINLISSYYVVESHLMRNAVINNIEIKYITDYEEFCRETHRFSIYFGDLVIDIPEHDEYGMIIYDIERQDGMCFIAIVVYMFDDFSPDGAIRKTFFQCDESE